MTMRIAAPCVVALSWRLDDMQGGPIDERREPTEYFVGGDELLPKVEQAITGHGVGYEADLHLEPEHAYGEYDAALVCFEQRSLFPAQLEPGMRFEGLPAGATSEGMPADATYTATEVYDSHVVLDANHPLAGIALRLRLKVHGVRAASAEEVAAKMTNDEGNDE